MTGTMHWGTGRRLKTLNIERDMPISTQTSRSMGFCRAVAIGFTLLTWVCGIRAEPAPYPAQAIRFVVPFSPGGSTDLVSRIVTQKVSQILNQPFVVDFKPGAGTIVGSDFVAKSKPDGYTLVLATNAHTLNPSLYSKLPFDARNDFSPVIYIGWTPSVIAVNPKSGIGSLDQLLQRAKARPGTIDFGTAGLGSIQHMTGELLNARAHVQMVHVPYRGGGPAITDVIGGQIPVLITGLPPAIAFIKAGSIVPLAVTSRRRSELLPNVPTVAESGFPEFDAPAWFAVLAPAGTPPAVLNTLNKAFNEALASPDVKRQLAVGGVDTEGGTPGRLGEFLNRDMLMWGAFVREAHIQKLS
jgi:tripartite-type tricarboxylate transporter receptor subunit TctC